MGEEALGLKKPGGPLLTQLGFTIIGLRIICSASGNLLWGENKHFLLGHNRLKATIWCPHKGSF